MKRRDLQNFLAFQPAQLLLPCRFKSWDKETSLK